MSKKVKKPALSRSHLRVGLAAARKALPKGVALEFAKLVNEAWRRRVDSVRAKVAFDAETTSAFPGAGICVDPDCAIREVKLPDSDAATVGAAVPGDSHSSRIVEVVPSPFGGGSTEEDWESNVGGGI